MREQDVVRWLWAALAGVVLACTVLALSGCAETNCALARSTGYYCPKGSMEAYK
jgi:hypothetical protein